MTCVVLMYHVIDDPRSAGEASLCLAPEQFHRQMAYLAEGGWRVIGLTELVECIRNGKGPPDRSVVITFDDGTACTHEVALPILAEFGFTASVFVVSHLLDGQNDWMIREGQPARRMLSRSQLLELDSAGIQIGSHTAHHIRMASSPVDIARQESIESKERLEQILGKSVSQFAYPYGEYNQEIRSIVEAAGYASAVTTRAGKNGAGSDLFALRRIEVMGSDSLLQFRLKLLSGTHDMPPWSLLRRGIKKVLGIESRRNS